MNSSGNDNTLVAPTCLCLGPIPSAVKASGYLPVQVPHSILEDLRALAQFPIPPLCSALSICVDTPDSFIAKNGLERQFHTIFVSQALVCARIGTNLRVIFTLWPDCRLWCPPLQLYATRSGPKSREASRCALLAFLSAFLAANPGSHLRFVHRSTENGNSGFFPDEAYAEKTHTFIKEVNAGRSVCDSLAPPHHRNISPCRVGTGIVVCVLLLVVFYRSSVFVCCLVLCTCIAANFGQ